MEYLDTRILVNDVHRMLRYYKISQGDLARTLNRSQGTISGILSSPKSWSQLSSKGRDIYLKLYMWLHNPTINPIINNQISKINRRPNKTFKFTSQQKIYLSEIYNIRPYPSKIEYLLISIIHQIPIYSLKIWFRNTRARKKATLKK
jgi:hypothetical protein